MPPLTPVSTSEAIESLMKLRSHFQIFGGTDETFSAIQSMEKALLKKKMEENSMQTRITDSFPVKQIILK